MHLAKDVLAEIRQMVQSSLSAWTCQRHGALSNISPNNRITRIIIVLCLIKFAIRKYNPTGAEKNGKKYAQSSVRAAVMVL